MNNIAQILTVLKRIHPTGPELTKIKILMACYGVSIPKKEIHKLANMPKGRRYNFKGLVADGLLECERKTIKYKTSGHADIAHYRTSQQGIEYLTKLMK